MRVNLCFEIVWVMAVLAGFSRESGKKHKRSAVLENLETSKATPLHGQAESSHIHGREQPWLPTNQLPAAYSTTFQEWN